MKIKRMIAAALVLCLLICELPAAGFWSVFAAGTQISYSRMDPEVMLLNAYTGNDSDFYTKVQSDSDYNFAEKISGLGYKKTISDDTSVSYANFGNTVLSKLSNQFYNQMEASYSATFNNKNGHTHAMGLITIDTSYISSAMYINGGTAATPTGLGGISSKTTRQGNNKFRNYYAGSGDLKIQYQNSKRIYTVLTGKEYKCSCGGDAYNHTILFRDQVAPFVMQTDILDASGNAASEFKVGDKIVIKLTCSEPLRFAGDAVPNNDVCIGLKVDGGSQGDQLIAKMTSLKTNVGSVYYNATNVSEMTFEYTVPDTMTGKVLSIIGLDFAPTNLAAGQAALYDTKGTVPLVQVGGSKKRTLDSNKGIGYTRTTSYVTDLAGNALEDKAAKCSFYIDSEAPYAAEITASASTKNANVKEALGKSSMDPQALTYADASDSNLGVGDEITFNVYMNELITPNLGDIRKYSCVYNGAKLTTNLLDAGGNPVTVTSSFAFNTASESSQYGKGSSAGRVTMLSFNPIKITENMHISDGSAEIRVADLEFTSDVKDNAVNAYTGSADKLTVAQKYKLDVKAPEITQGSARSASYGGKAYVYQFTVSDESGVTGLNGTFDWYSGNSTTPYEYALTASSEEPSQWFSATMYRDISFTQTGAPQYLHIRPVNGQQYDIHSSSIAFGLSDYAGNHGFANVDLGNGIVLDTVAPDVAAGSVSRNFDSGTNKGTMTVTVNITDAGAALKEPVAAADRPMYIWATSGAAITAGSEGWLQLGGVIDGANTAFTLTAKVDNGSCFEKDLYVKAGDSFGNNTGAVKVGTYTYNLKSVKYDLGYSSAVTTKADVRVNALDSGGFLFFYTPTGNANEYYGCCMTAASSANIFSDSSLWGKYTLSESGGGMTFTKTGDASDWPYDYDATLYIENFTGIIDVSVVSGYTVSLANAGGAVTISGSVKPYGTERFKLYVVKDANSYTPMGSSGHEYNYTDVFDDVLNVSFTNKSGTVLDRFYSNWRLTDEYVIESPAGLPFEVSITPKSGYDWVLDDIDLSESKILIYRGNKSVSYEHIGEIPLSNSFTQMAYLPELDYGKGEIHLQLLLKRKANCPRSYYSNNNCIISLFVDNTPASDDFELSHVIHTYEQKNNDLNPGTAELMFGITADEVFTSLPVDRTPYNPENGTGSSVMTVPYYHYEDSYNGDWNSEIYLTFTSNGLDTAQEQFGSEHCTSGLSVVRAWNVTCNSEKIQLDKLFFKENYDPENESPFMSSYLARGGRLRLMLADDPDSANALAEAGTLGVVKNTVNIIAVQAVYQNGNVSAVKYYAINPKEETDYPTITPYTDSVDVSAYNRAVGQESCYEAAFALPGDRTLYNWRENTPEGLPGEREAFTTQDNRVYSYTMPSGENWASIFMKDAYGIAVPLTMISGHISDKDAPVINVDSPLTFDAGSGTFSTTFTVSDETFRYHNPRVVYSGINIYDNSFMPTLHVGFDSDYSKTLGITPDTALDIKLDMMFLYDTEGKNYESGLDEDARLYSLWTTDGTDGTGITAIYARLTNDEQLKVTVQGSVSPAVAAEDGQDVTLNVAVSDALGNRSDAVSTTADDVFGKVPVVTDAVYKNISSTTWDKALFLTFSAPVRPVESWINRSISGYQTTWYDAFPITNDGDWDITYTDLFGNTYTKQLSLENVFGEYGFDLSISTLDPTAEDVTISAATDDGKDCFMSFSYDPASRKQSYGGYVNGDDAPLYTAGAKTRIVSNEGCYGFFRFDAEYLGEKITDPYRADCTFIYLDNVAKAAPEAKLSFYFEEFGDSFTPEELFEQFPDGVMTTDFVRVSYDTARHVTANGEKEHLFTYDGETSCSFSYTDDFGHDGGVTVDLADYGITFAAPPEPFRDNEKPLVSVDIYAKRGGAYLQSEFFSSGDSEARVVEAFADTSYVQDYSLALNVTDYSEYRILLLDSEPSTLNYDSGSTFSNENVTLNGNTIHIGKDFRTGGADFWIAVVDNAVAGTGASADNFTCFKVLQGELAKWFDNQNPEILDQKEIADSLYQHTLYLKFSDKSDSGAATPADSLNVSGLLHKNTNSEGACSSEIYPYCITFNSNTELPVTIADAAGNYILSMLKPLTEIDDSKPVLTVRWSPGLVDENGIDESLPTNGPVNTQVTAHIYSDKPIDLSATTLAYENYSGDYTALPQDGSYWDIFWDETSQRVTVRFSSEYSSGETIKATVYAPNGQYENTYLQLPYGAIDMTPPSTYVGTEPLMRAGASVPYGLRYTMEFYEDVLVDGVPYDRYTPYTLVLYGKSARNVNVTDLAGNTCVHCFNTESYTVVPDNKAPVITFIDPVSGDLSGADAAGGVVTAALKSNEACTVSYDGRSKTLAADTETDISFTSNGTRTLYFTDDAGNKTEITMTVSTIDNVIPVITMSTSTVKLMQGSGKEVLDALLNGGVSASDNSGSVTLTCESSSVVLNVPGTYTVTYTAVDGSGNKATAKRFVKVISKYLPRVSIDGELLENSGIISIKPGKHMLTVSNLREEGEPYKLVIVRGIYYDGQIKYLKSQVPLGDDGSFTINAEGFYTFYLQTQSRQSLRCLINVEE